MLDCVSVFRAEDFHLRDPDLYLACPYHQTTLAPEVSQPAVRPRVWVTTLVLAAAVAVAVMFLAREPRAPSASPVVHARMAPVDEAFVGELLVIQMQIWNAGPGRVEQVVVTLDRSYARYLVIVHVEPEPEQKSRTRKADRMWFRGLREGEVLDVQLHVKPFKAGTVRLAAQVMIPGSGRRERTETALGITP